MDIHPLVSKFRMISYVECLSGEGAGPSVKSHCWNGGPDEERDELLPRKMPVLQPKTEGSLRRRLLSAKIYQQHDAILALNAKSGCRPRSALGDRKLPTANLQCLGNSPWHLPPRPHIHPSFTPEVHGKLFHAPEAHKKPIQPFPPTVGQHPSYPILNHRHQTCSFTSQPVTTPSYLLPVPSPHNGANPLKEPQVPPQYHYQPTKNRKTKFFSFRSRRGRGSKQQPLQTTPLLHKGDGDSKWAVHYTTQKPQQGLRFIRGKRQSNSADDLRAFHWPAQQSPGSKPCPPSPTFSPLSSVDQSDGSGHRGWRDRSRKMHSRALDFLSQSCFSVCFKFSFWRRKSSASSDDDERFFLTKGRPMTPLVLNPISLTSCTDGLTPNFESNWDTETEPIQRLPTPEEKMRRQAEAVAADIVPINVTGESFDRQASFRRTLSNSDSLSRRSRKLSRRKTVSSLQDDATSKASVSVDLPGQFSTVGRPASSCSSSRRQKNKEKEVEEGGEMIRTEQLSSRRIRAPKGEGMSSLMATLTTSPRIERQPTAEIQTELSPTFNFSSDSDPYQMITASSSYCQSWDLQGSPSDLHPQLFFDTNARVRPDSLSSSCLCFLSTTVNSNPNTPCHLHQSECSHFNKKAIAEDPSCSHYLSTSSISDSVSQFSYQTLDDKAINAQYFHDSDSCDGKRWNYEPISPSSSVHSGGIQKTRDVSEEHWNCDPLLSSGRSTPSCMDSNSCCSEITSSSSLTRRKSSTSSFYSPTITRSISLRKSKRPPPPPVRSDSLRRRSGRNKPSRSSSSLRLEHSPRMERSAMRTPTLSPQVFYDPWVPQSNGKQQQSGSNCRTVTSFEPLNPHMVTSPESPPFDSTQTSHDHSHVLSSNPSSSKDEQLKFPHNKDPPDFSVAGIQRLASPSSGYSSQSNTPTPGTPVSSPLSPSSPLTPSIFPPSPFSSSCSTSFPLPPASSLQRKKSRAEGKPKPPVPERKSSLLSSPSSSFSSTSSLSSFTSSDSSARHPLLPPPPPPPPLPKFFCSSSAPTTPVSKFCAREPLPFTKHSVSSNLPPFSYPPPPPLPESLPSLPPPPPPTFPTPNICFPTNVSSIVSNPLPLPAPPPPPPLLQPSHSPFPSSARPPPPPYSYAVKRTSDQALGSKLPPNIPPPPLSPPPIQSLDLSEIPDLPPPPPPPQMSPPSYSTPFFSFYPPNFDTSSDHDAKAASPPGPLVTMQALRRVKLRSVKNQEEQRANNNTDDGVLLTQAGSQAADKNAQHYRAELDVVISETFSNAEVELAESKLQDAFSDIFQDEVNGFVGNSYSPDSDEAKMPSLTNNMQTKPENTMAGNESADSDQRDPDTPQNGQPIQSFLSSQHQRKNAVRGPSLGNSEICDPESPWVKMSHITEKAKTNTVVDQEQWLLETELTNTAEKKRGDIPEPSEHKNYVTKKDAAKGDSTSADMKNTAANFRLNMTRKTNSPEKPVPPKKPDFCLQDPAASPKVKRGTAGGKSSGQIAAHALGPNSPSRVPAECFYKPLPAHISKSSQSPKLVRCTTDNLVTTGHCATPKESPTSSSQSQKPLVLDKKPELSLASPKKEKTQFVPKNVGESFGATATPDGISKTGNAEGEMSASGPTAKTTAANASIKSSFIPDTKGHDGPTGMNDNTSPLKQNRQTGKVDPYCAIKTTSYQDEGKSLNRKIIRPSMAEEEEEAEEKRVAVRGRDTVVTMMMTSTNKKYKPNRRRKRRLGKQLLMLSPKTEPSPSSLSSSSSSSSSSSLSSSSEDEQDLMKGRRERLRTINVHNRDLIDSKNSCDIISGSRFSISSVLSADSLQGELSLPDLLIQEVGEKEAGEVERFQKRDEESNGVNTSSDDNLLVNVSAEQMFVSRRPRTTEDLFAVIHRSKRKMLGRKDSHEERQRLSSSSSTESTTVPVSQKTWTSSLWSHRSGRSESFKALLLRKGSRSSSQISAAERLRIVRTPFASTDGQRAPPQAAHQAKPENLGYGLTTTPTEEAPLTSMSSCIIATMFASKQQDPTLSHLLASSPLLIMSSSSSSNIRTRSLTPPCSASRRFAARCHLYGAPMTAIYEADGEEEDEDVFIQSPGGSRESSLRLVEIS